MAGLVPRLSGSVKSVVEVVDRCAPPSSCRALSRGIHVLPSHDGKTWMAGTSPAMTTSGGSDPLYGRGLVAQKPEPDTRGSSPGMTCMGMLDSPVD